MNKFGVLKTKILKKLTESYDNKNKSEIKEVVKLIKENKDFREMYLFYEELENKYIVDKEIAKVFVEEVISLLKNKKNLITEVSKKIDKRIGKIDIEENVLYSNLDLLLEDDSLQNIDRKLIAKKSIVDHLTTKKEPIVSEVIPTIQNENLLNAVLVNNFNIIYENTLTNDQKLELNSILSFTDEELKEKFFLLKEDVSTHINNVITEDTNADLKDKYNNVLLEIWSMEVDKYNYYKLSQLKSDLL